MIYELRLYSVAPGRMAEVHSRFADHLPVLFERHRVDCVGRWSALAGPDAPRFVYLLAYRDYAHREAVWAGFYQDADWWRIRAHTNAGHEMVERHDLYFLKPNAAWDALDGAPAQQSVGGLHELVQQQVAPGQAAAVNEFIKQSWLPRLREAGARVLGVFDMAAGSGMQKVVLLYAWPDAATWYAGQRRLDTDESLRAELAAQRRKLGTTLFQRGEVNLLEPAPGTMIRAGLGRHAD
ncbi:MAG: NIPSNAP family protein [Rhodoferax sp.]|nr:NIPSNAP family protein [Rhodoferax sp.]